MTYRSRRLADTTTVQKTTGLQVIARREAVEDTGKNPGFSLRYYATVGRGLLSIVSFQPRLKPVSSLKARELKTIPTEQQAVSWIDAA
jgi:hypothetical protein